MERLKDRFHCCASCKHFSIENNEGEITTRCARLGYETNPKWQFNCWSPKDRVRRSIAEARKAAREGGRKAH
jgi:hypothetical protein